MWDDHQQSADRTIAAYHIWLDGSHADRDPMQEYASKLNGLMEGEPSYSDLDVVDEKALQPA